jgi:hypothetical protein
VWFKTRVSVAELQGSFEVLAWRDPETPRWMLYALSRSHEEREFRTGFRKEKINSPSIVLACFPEGAGVAGEIGMAMRRIAEAAAAGARMCDLSDVGSPAGWDKQWVQIEWS